jgi:N-acetylglutamate synthase-like GNAT family acetyltransferase
MSDTASEEKPGEEPKVEIMEYSDDYKQQVKDLIFDIAENELKRHSKSGRPDLDNIGEIYQTKKGNFWIATENGEIIGTIALKDMGEDRGDLWRFYVRKDMRRKGVGGKLFSTLKEFALENGYKKIFISTQGTQEAANKFYIKIGAKRTEAPPKDFPHSSNDKTFYELDLEKK